MSDISKQISDFDSLCSFISCNVHLLNFIIENNSVAGARFIARNRTSTPFGRSE